MTRSHLPAARHVAAFAVAVSLATLAAPAIAVAGTEPSPAADGVAAATDDAIRRAREAAARGLRKEALDHARRAVELAPESVEALRLHATLGLDAGLAAAVAPSVEALARLRPDDAEAVYLVGRTWMALGDPKQAAEALARAVDLDPDLLPARGLLGLALVAESRFAEAREHLEPYVAARPADLEAVAALAVAEERLGEAAAAERRARGVLERAPEQPTAHLVIGMVRSGEGDWAAARVALERAVAADPWLAKAHYQLAFACGRLGDRACADAHLALYRRALAGEEAAMTEMTRQTPPPGAMAPAPDPDGR